jgi:hypothetical protein
MKFVLFTAILASLTIYAQTTVKKEKAANGDVKMITTTKDKTNTVTSTSEISKKEMDEAAPFFKAMSECKSKQMKNIDGDMAVEHEVHGLVKDKCKVTSKATIKNKLVSFTSCLLTAEDRKSLKTNGLENYSKLMMDGKTCTMETDGQKF